MSKPLSATMVACIDDAQEAGGELVRYMGGFWSDRAGGHPSVNRRAHHGTSTVEAIVSRGHAEYSEWRDGRNGRFPIAVRLTRDNGSDPQGENGRSPVECEASQSGAEGNRPEGVA